MKPTWQTDDGQVQLYLADCLTVLPTLETGSIDVVITDPPFGIDFKYDLHDDTSDGYGKWLWSIIEQCEQKAKPGSPVFVWQAMPNVRKFAEWFPRDWRIFAACKGFVQRPTQMQYAFDPVVVWWKDGEAFDNKDGVNRDWYVSNVAPWMKPESDAPGHPCPRPLAHLVHIVWQWVRPGSVVLDPFMGSGTTGVACAQLGRRFIGIEISEVYFQIAVKRIERVIYHCRTDE